MDHRTERPDEHELAAERAAEWLSRAKSGRTVDKTGFLRWLKRSPDNIGESLLAASTDIVLRQLLRNRPADVPQASSTADNVIRIGNPETPARRAALWRRPRVWVASASMGLAAALTLFILAPTAWQNFWHPNLYRTSVGEQRAVELADGSVVSINARSSVRVNLTAQTRDVYLNEGQAMFSVAKDAKRPFRVHVAGNIVQAVGTKFDVRRRADRTHVSVVEGIVQISSDRISDRTPASAPPLALTRVTAGETVSIVDTGLITPPAPINVADVGAWQQRRLVFSDSTLLEIAEEFARYNRAPHLRIEGESLRERRLSGVFDADSPEALLMYLSADHTLAFDRSGEDIVIRLRPVIVQSEADP